MKVMGLIMIIWIIVSFVATVFYVLKGAETHAVKIFGKSASDKANLLLTMLIILFSMN